MRFVFVGFAAVALSVANAGVVDNFNRPDANSLGPDWTAEAGGAQIINNQAGGLIDRSLLIFNNLSSDTISVDVLDSGASTQYIALVLGYHDINNNYFIKVQNNGAGNLFDHVAFYYGNNGSGLSGIFEPLSTPFAHGTVTASLTGTAVALVVLPIGGPEQTYSYDYGTISGGSGIGLGFYGSALADNFSAGTAVPEPSPATLLLPILGVAFLAKRFRRPM